MEKSGRPKQARAGNRRRRMRFACRTHKARIQTRVNCLTIIAFPRLQWLRERASRLRYMYSACLVVTSLSDMNFTVYKNLLNLSAICLQLISFLNVIPSNFMMYGPCTLKWNCTITNVTRTFLYLFPYLLLPYMFRAFFKPVFRGRCTNSAVVLVFWVWCQRPGHVGTVLFQHGPDTADFLHSASWRWA
jgi:hypothetical protein